MEEIVSNVEDFGTPTANETLITQISTYNWLANKHVGLKVNLSFKSPESGARKSRLPD